MYKIHVEKELKMPIDKAFEAITDHANYSLYAGIKKSSLLRSGKEDKNGVGAVREIVAGALTLQEEIVDYEYPHKMGYRITNCKPVGMHHPFGEINLEKLDDNLTKVVWQSEFGFKVPLIGNTIDQFVGPNFSKAFASLLRGMEKRYIFFNK